MLLLTLILGWVVFIYGRRRLGGDSGGLLSLAAYVAPPTFIVFGPLVLTDIAVTLFCLLSLWQFAKTRRDPSPGSSSSSARRALLSKFSSGLLFIAFEMFASARLLLCQMPSKPVCVLASRPLAMDAQRHSAGGHHRLWFFFSPPASIHRRPLSHGHSARWVRCAAHAAVAVSSRGYYFLRWRAPPAPLPFLVAATRTASGSSTPSCWC